MGFELIHTNDKDPRHSEILDLVSMLTSGACGANPRTNEFFGFMGATLLFETNADSYTLNIYSANKLPPSIGGNDVITRKPFICYLALSRPSLQELILEQNTSIDFKNVTLVHPTLKTAPLVTVDPVEAEEYIAYLHGALSMHYKNIFKELAETTLASVCREHLFFKPQYFSGIYKGTFSYKTFNGTHVELLTNEIITHVLDEYFSKEPSTVVDKTVIV